LTTFADPDDINHPEFKNTRASYWATLCEAHLAVVNELIQRYRMATYDPFAYEVSARDVPIWNLKHATDGWVVIISQYRSLDEPPVFVDRMFPKKKPKVRKVRKVEYCELNELKEPAALSSSPGEFDLLDARSLMERGDFTGAAALMFRFAIRSDKEGITVVSR